MTVIPVYRSWQRIETWLAEHAPRTFDSLRPPASADAISAAADELRMKFPADLVESLRCHDGVSPGHGLFQFPGGDQPLGIDAILRRGRMDRQLWNRLGEDHPDETYWHPEFLMFADSNPPDGLVLDCREGATFGAVGTHLKGGGTSFGRWPSLAAFLHELAGGLEHGLAMGWWRKFVPVVWQETLLWEEEPQPLPVPRSLREIAATVAAPAAPEVGQEPLPVVAEEGWAGEYASFCLSFVRGLDESELLRRFGALADTHRPRSRGQAQADAQRWTAGLLPVVRAGRCGQWAFGIEEGHRWEGNRSEVLRRLSRGTQAVSPSFSGATTMSYYEDGGVVTVYDTRRSYQQPGEGDPFDIFPELPAHGPAAGRLLPDGRTSLGSLEVPTERTPLLQRATLRSVCGVVSDHFGIDLPPGALTGELASAQVLPVLPGVDGRYRPPTELAEHITTASEARLRTVLATQMCSLAAETGLDTYPEVIEALHRAGQDECHGVDDDSPLGIRLRTVFADAAAAWSLPRDDDGHLLIDLSERDAWQHRANAAGALADALSLPAREVIGSVLHQRRNPDWRAEFTEQLGEAPHEHRGAPPHERQVRTPTAHARRRRSTQ
ncbi:SMI1/KNR4 family protein [[Kitasatospora] papulosa]|uniref:SMI1/KNR4 family protein n=1 Tax=Streptomyces TaxID=1883 RepID=UPI000DC421EA|nr:SMI1/KNR4 family protein [Streptomyces sp. P9-2B-1]RAS24358.1 cell wall assembly regulator SMI1 [Streptomyces avidinii]WJY35375.1 SMI1/KNR4 family protein [Streptomyces sp. P9-2B-1]